MDEWINSSSSAGETVVLINYTRDDFADRSILCGKANGAAVTDKRVMASVLLWKKWLIHSSS